MSALFWFIAGVAAGVAATFAATPLWRVARGASGRASLYYAIVGCGVAIFGAATVLIYHLIDHPATVSAPATTAAAAPAGKARSLEEATAGLEARLARQGGSPSDWTLLAQSYEFLGRTADAQRARERALSSGAPPATGAEPSGPATGTPAAGMPAAANTNIASVWEAAAAASPSQNGARP
jgi:DNA-binding transcriptional regulator YdaS (Cro superfamily)